jgi:hypothetical protein
VSALKARKKEEKLEPELLLRLDKGLPYQCLTFYPLFFLLS